MEQLGIGLLIMLAVLSPLAWLRPSRQQQKSTQVRQAARRMGLLMQLSQQTWPHWLGRSAPQLCPQYGLPRALGNTIQGAYWQTSVGVWLNKWREPCASPELQSALEELPADVYKVETMQGELFVYWGERGGMADLLVIHRFISAYR